jgi:hypothetical protein
LYDRLWFSFTVSSFNLAAGRVKKRKSCSHQADQRRRLIGS